jgi:DNA-binding NarL/FixJ family response regulator
MSVPSNEARALIVDAQPLRGLGIATVLYRLFESNRCRITSISSPMDAEALIAGSVRFRVIIYSVGAESVGDFKHRKGIKTLRELAAPIVIFSDNDTRKEAVLALSIGVQGFLHSGMAVELTQQALSFILQGGSYFPAWQESRSRPSRHNGSVDPSGANGTPEHALGTASSNDSLTKRQRSVLEGVKRGQTNKTIARALGIREGTVKVYVRQLMRKIGVNNRTKLAIASNTVSEIERPGLSPPE